MEKATATRGLSSYNLDIKDERFAAHLIRR